MKEILKNLNVEAIETHGFNFDLKKYDVIDITHVNKLDIFHGAFRRILTVEEYLEKMLSKGHGLYFDEKVYYRVNLLPDIINIHKRNLENYISNEIELARQDRYKIQLFLTHPKHELSVKNAMHFYRVGYDLDFIRKRLEGKVKDVEEFMEYLQKREGQIAN